MSIVFGLFNDVYGKRIEITDSNVQDYVAYNIQEEVCPCGGDCGCGLVDE